jgi:hypothetical protein
MASRSSNEEFASTWVRYGGHVVNIAKALACGERAVYRRRPVVEAALGIVLPAGHDATGRSKVKLPKHGFRHILKVTSGIVPVFSDGHFWPSDDRSTGYLALLEIINEYKPPLVICNGDAFDGARAGRHPPTGWSNMPDVADEIATCQERLGEIAALARAGNPDCMLAWHMGNHDSRFSQRLATVAPDYVRVHGTDLPDHFPDWSFAWSALINGHTMVKHRFRAGVHAAWNNTLHAGMSIVTGHCHRLCVTPLTDYNGRRWGVDCGTISEFGPDAEKYTYGEDNPMNWGEGFAVLTFDDKGVLAPPELVQVIDGKAWFRGQVIAQKPLKAKPTRLSAPALASR